MWVGRLPDGNIYGTWTCRQPDDADHLGIEELPDDHPDVVAFINRPVPDFRAANAALLDSAATIAQLRAAVKQVLGL